MYDILIVGGGPAGLTAAIYARRAGKSVLVAEGTGLGGQIVTSPLVENWPGQRAVAGAEWSEVLAGQAADLGAEIVFRQVTGAEKTAEGFVLTAGKKRFEGRALILATGAKHRHLGVAREEELVGRGVSYCATCDGAFFAGADVAVVGGGDTALQAALYLANTAKSVTLIHRRDQFRGSEVLEERVRERENVTLKLSRRVKALVGEDALTGVVLEDVDTGASEDLAVSGLFISVGQAPENAAFAHLADLDGSGYFAAGEDCAAKTPGVFVAGDCRAKALRQLTTAAADGSVAATAACQWLDGQ